MAKGDTAKTDVLQGTLDLMVLQTLDTMGALHGYGIARRIEQVSGALLKLNEGTVYTSLMRLLQSGRITAHGSMRSPAPAGNSSSPRARSGIACQA